MTEEQREDVATEGTRGAGGSSAAHGDRRPGWIRVLRWVGPLVSAALFLLALLAIRHFLRNHGVDEIVREVRALPASALIAALLFTAISYLILTGYDVLALRYVNRDFPYYRIAFTSFVCYSLSHNIGMSALSGGSARYRIYSTWGVTVIEAAQIIVFCNLTFWVGFFALGGPLLITHVIPIPAFAGLPFADGRAIGVICAVVSVALLLWVAFGPRQIRVRGRAVRMPRLRPYLLQILVASLDWMAAAAVLHALLPETAGSYLDTLSLFLIGQVVAMVSNVPGGMGVFESLLLYLAGDQFGVAPLMGALIIYRVIYYLLPLAVAVLMLAFQEVHRRLRRRHQEG